MVVPIAVLTASEAFPSGWHAALGDTPIWWDEPSTRLTQVLQPSSKPKKRKQRPRNTQFELEEIRSEAQTTDWVAALLASPIFQEQKS